ncbi:hypothetical protein ABK905_06445 [Acerihabitans sp. KWT182]|uniref:Uncharacterized protein n=1 Tax=Acerihabitans sp. KWT182 TaxID=3157919 RepID=A0AAU7QCK8_9GAMM
MGAALIGVCFLARYQHLRFCREDGRLRFAVDSGETAEGETAASDDDGHAAVGRK